MTASCPVIFAISLFLFYGLRSQPFFVDLFPLLFFAIFSGYLFDLDATSTQPERR